MFPAALTYPLDAISCVAGWACVAGGISPIPQADGAYGVYFSETPIADVDPPAAIITSPQPGETYTPGEPITAVFDCVEGIGGPGLSSCLDSNGSTSPGTLATTAIGTYEYSVTATSADGQSATSTISYNVADPPTANITSPASGEVVNYGQLVPVSFACTEGDGGPGIASCDGIGGATSPGTLPTDNVGSQTYTVEATSADGLSSTTSISYTVAVPQPLSSSRPESIKPSTRALWSRRPSVAPRAPTGPDSRAVSIPTDPPARAH